jgi:type I restriction enzyme S subunit
MTERVPIEDLISEGSLLIGDGYRAKLDELCQAGLPFARAGNIDGGFHFEDADLFPEESLSRVGNKVSAAGDVVFTSKGTVGRFALVRESTPRFVYSPQLCFWRVLNHSKIDARFLYYWMASREFYSQFKGVAGQTDMAEYVSLRDQRRMHITLPTVDDQHRIAKVLGTLDDKIELNRRMNETLEAIARAIFKSWFVDFDPVRRRVLEESPYVDLRSGASFPESFEESELGAVPTGWHVQALYDCAEYLNGLAFRAADFCQPGVGLPIIKIAELKQGITKQTKFTQRELESKYRVSSGDILFSWSGSPDTSIDTFLWTGPDGWLNQHIFKIRVLRSENKLFVYYLLKSLKSDFVEIARNKQTTGLGHVTAMDLKRLKVVLPTPEALLLFNRAVEPLYDMAYACSRQSTTLAEARDVLLPKLISGEIYVKEAEQTVGALV